MTQTDNSENVMSAIKHLLSPKTEDLGEFSVRRLLPHAKQRMVGPWVFFDHMGPATFQPGPGINVRPHPHINLATVTYLFNGEILHRDSLGVVETIRPNDLNIMVAGKGITHSEREQPAALNATRQLHGLQLWFALPVADEETDPEFLHYAADELPVARVDDVSVRVMMGDAYGVSSPAKQFATTLYAEATLESGQTLAAPRAEELAVYIVSGSLLIDGNDVPAYSLVILDTQQTAIIEANSDSRVAFIGGENIGPRHMYWNFVSSRKERIEQAKQDWLQRRFEAIPGDDEEFIPLPD